MKRTKNKPTRRHARNQPSQKVAAQKLPFIAHIYELRRRFFFVAIAVILFGALAYAANKPLTSLLLRPADGQQFIYTSPGGGFDFLFKLCLYSGIAASIPVIIYQLLRYLQPLIKKDAMRFIAWGTVASGGLAIVGILFGYLFGLPAAMHFLLHGFSSEQIQALITIQSYMSFVMLYLLGAVLLFQVPLVLILINRIKPLRPGGLMKFQRWFIVFAFVAGAIINPSPNIQDQLMLSVPMIVMYQLGILLVWLINRKHGRPKKVMELLRKDAELQAERLANFKQAQVAWDQLIEHATRAHQPADTSAAIPADQHRRRTQDFNRPTRRTFGGQAAQSQ